jgi:ATP-dependent helicase/DNAse subunit B
VRLITGPAGSGKSGYILEQVKRSLQAREPAARLLVPTATLAQHLQNSLARDGFVLRRGAVQTLSSFVRELTPQAAEAADPVLYLLVEQAARKVARPEFTRVVDLPGFCASLKRVIDEFAAAGCDSARLSDALPDEPLAPAFLAVYREVERELARRGLVTRSGRLALAAERVGTLGLRTLWLDGFHVLTDPELRLIEAAGQSAEVTLAMGDEDLTEDVRARLFVLGFEEERAEGYRGQAVRALFKAPSLEREAEEIARRILEQASAGRPFREMGVIVRAANVYEPVLRTTFERFAIPARFYFDASLERHPAVRFLTGVVDAMLAAWDHSKTLAALRLAPRFAESGAMDRFDFAVREQIPNAGLSGLKSLLLDKEGVLRPASEPIDRKLDSLATIEEWRRFELEPKDWAARMQTLRNLFRPASPRDRASHHMALEWRAQSDALDAFDQAAGHAAQSLPAGHAVTLETYWRALRAVLRVTPLRSIDSRRNVVHVISTDEARQWVLPVVFVCGMVERQFPRFQQQDPFFPDVARRRLNESGIRVRTTAEFERRERALFESAITRATILTVLSYPEFDARGERNLPSLYLEDLLLDLHDARTVRPAAPRAVTALPEAGIRDTSLVEWLQSNTAAFSPTGLESYLQCPFQYFANKTLRLRKSPDPPEKRLNFPLQGNIVHDVLKEWWDDRQDIVAVFERVFARYLSERHIPSGYHTERLRNTMLDDLLRFVREDRWPYQAASSRTEEGFQYELAPGIVVNGRIDRIDTAPDGKAYVIDYKYSRGDNVKKKLENVNLLQAPLYLMAAERLLNTPAAGVFYVGLRLSLEYVGWSESPMLDSVPIPERWRETTRDRVLHIVGQVRGGSVSVSPADPDLCKYCDARDVCRVTAAEAALEEPEAQVEVA